MTDKPKIDKFKKFLTRREKDKEHKEKRRDNFSWSPEHLVPVETPKKLDEATFKGATYEEPAQVSPNKYIRRMHLAQDHARDAKEIDDEHHNHDNNILNAVRKYKLDSYLLNSFHRSGFTTSPGSTKMHKEHTEHLDKVTSNRTKRGAIVYRGFDADFSKNSEQFASMKPGNVYHDKGYVSTSHNIGIAENFASSGFHKNGEVVHHIAAIHLPKGTRSHYIDDMSQRRGFENSQEEEHLIHRGTHFKVLGHSQHKNPHSGKTYHMVHLQVHKNDHFPDDKLG